jgi:hypothetical protein
MIPAFIRRCLPWGRQLLRRAWVIRNLRRWSKS